MKRLILILIIGIILLNLSLVLAENCKVAWPQFGVVSCEVFYGSTPQIETKSFSCSGTSCSISFSCAGRSNCAINNIASDITASCSNSALYSYYYTINVDGKIMPSSGEYGNCWVGCDNPPNSGTGKFGSLTINGECRTQIKNKAPLVNSKATISYENIYLYDTTPDYPKHKVDSSVGCVPNGIMFKSGYTSRLPSSWVDSNGNAAEKSKPSDIVDAVTNMDPGKTYSYLYGWREVANINLINGKDGNPAGYCGGNLGDRKLLSYSKIDGNDGCYIIPTSVQKNVECCYNEDCKWKDASGKYICDPTTFTCSLERPCNSDYDCQIIGEESCSNKIETSWKCDLSSQWQPYKGTCKKETKTVLCCSDNDCSDKEYCDKESGCKAKYVFEECPSNKCCKFGGDFKEKGCSSGEKCCTSGGYVGECKESCEPIPISSDNKIVETAKDTKGYAEDNGEKILSSTSEESSSTGTIVLVVFLILISSSIGFFVYVKNKDKKPKTKKEQGRSAKHCSKCGNTLKAGSKFCTKCGRKTK